MFNPPPQRLTKELRRSVNLVHCCQRKPFKSYIITHSVSGDTKRHDKDFSYNNSVLYSCSFSLPWKTEGREPVAELSRPALERKVGEGGRKGRATSSLDLEQFPPTLKL